MCTILCKLAFVWERVCSIYQVFRAAHYLRILQIELDGLLQNFPSYPTNDFLFSKHLFIEAISWTCRIFSYTLGSLSKLSALPSWGPSQGRKP